MALQVVSETGTIYKPVFLDITKVETLPGGVTVAVDRVPSDTKFLLAGTLLAAGSTTGIYQFVKTGTSLKTHASAKTIYVDSKAQFVAGEYLSVYGKTTGTTISSVLRSTNTLRVICGTKIGTMSTTSQVAEVAAAGATLLLFGSSVGFLKDTVRVRWDDLTSCHNVSGAVVIRGSVKEANLPTPALTAHKTALTARIYFA